MRINDPPPFTPSAPTSVIATAESSVVRRSFADVMAEAKRRDAEGKTQEAQGAEEAEASRRSALMNDPSVLLQLIGGSPLHARVHDPNDDEDGAASVSLGDTSAGSDGGRDRRRREDAESEALEALKKR